MNTASSTCIFMRKVTGQAEDKLFNAVKFPAENEDTKKAENEDPHKARKEFVSHFACMQSWYIRVSSIYKLKFVKQLFIRLKSTNALGLILNALLIWSSKATYYSIIQHNTNFAYDKMLLDTNRSIYLKHFKKIEKLELEWFESLAESEQTLIIVGLIRRSGGQFVHELFQFGERLQNQLASQKHLIDEDEQFKTLLENRPRFNESEFNLRNTQSIPNLITYPIHSLSSNPENIKRLNASLTAKVNYQEKEDTTNPFSIEVVKRKKVWDTLISSYRIQVEGKPKKPGKDKKGKDKKGKNKKDKKGKDKKKKKEKSGKKSKKGKKGKKKGEVENIDLIQMLPYWTVLQIFSYLDAKTLKKIKAVNKYWEFAANELKKCLKARKAINKLIAQMAANVGDVEEIEEKFKIYKPADEGQLPKKRLLKLSERGSAIKKLQKKVYKQTTMCLLSDALDQMHEYYVVPVRCMEIFPRDIDMTNAENVPKIPSCIINELGFSKIDKSDFTSNESFSFDEICNFDNQNELHSDRQNYFAMSAYTFDIKF